jgi:catalase
MAKSPALSIIAKTKPSFAGRTVGCLVTDGIDAGLIGALRKAVEAEGSNLKIIAPMIGGVTTADADMLQADMQLAGAPSIFFDAVVIAASQQGTEQLLRESAARDFVSDAFAHLKVIGYVDTALPLLRAAGIDEDKHDDGVVSLGKKEKPANFIAAARKHRIWHREPHVRLIP